MSIVHKIIEDVVPRRGRRNFINGVELLTVVSFTWKGLIQHTDSHAFREKGSVAVLNVVLIVAAS